MSVQNLEISRSSASGILSSGNATGLRSLPAVSKYIDTSTCIGCKACEVACQEWNDLKVVPTAQTGTYQTMPTLDPSFWNLIRFDEHEVEGGLMWLMRKDQCMHCAEPGCLEACPAPGAIVQYANGIVDVNPEQCIGCGYCATGCPFEVPKFHAATGKMAKCTLCVDRVSVGLEPACIKACPTGCLHFGTKDDMVALGNHRVEQLKANGFPNAALYDPKGVGGHGRRHRARARRPPRVVRRPASGPARPDRHEVLEERRPSARAHRHRRGRRRRLRALPELRQEGSEGRGGLRIQPSAGVSGKEKEETT